MRCREAKCLGGVLMSQTKRKKLIKDWMDEAAIADMQEKMSSNEMTSEDLVFMYNCDK